MTGKHHSLKSRLKMSLNHQGKTLSAEHRRHMSEAHYRYLDKMSPEVYETWCNHISESLTGLVKVNSGENTSEMHPGRGPKIHGIERGCLNPVKRLPMTPCLF